MKNKLIFGLFVLGMVVLVGCDIPTYPHLDSISYTTVLFENKSEIVWVNNYLGDNIFNGMILIGYSKYSFPITIGSKITVCNEYNIPDYNCRTIKYQVNVPDAKCVYIKENGDIKEFDRDCDNLNYEGYPCQDSCENITLSYCHIFGISQGEKIDFKTEYAIDRCVLNFFDIFPRLATEPYRIDNLTIELVEENKTNCKQCWKLNE